MSSCCFCKKDMPDWRRVREHIIITRGDDKDGKLLMHTHVPDNSREVRLLMQEAVNSLGLGKELEYPVAHSKTLPEKVLFYNGNRIGDIICMTGAVRSFCLTYPNVKVNIKSKAQHIWDNNPRLDYSVTGPEVQIGPRDGTNMSDRALVNLTRSFEMCIERELRVQMPPGLPYGDLWFSEQEYREEPEVERPYVIIVTGGGAWGLKCWPLEYFQEVVNQNPNIKFVQVGNKNESKALSGNNIVNMIGKTEDPNCGIRRLLKLFLNSEGSLGLVSMHCHLSGALQKPHIVIGAGREPAWFTMYYGSQYLSTNGCLPCNKHKACWHCDIKTKDKDGTERFNCSYMIERNGKQIPLCADIISPELVTAHLQLLYKGGRLSYDRPTEKFDSKGNCLYRNVVKEPRMHPHLSSFKTPDREDVELEIEDNWVGFDGKKMLMQGGAITWKDWSFILNEILDKYKPKKILEIGCGLSTLLWAKRGLEVISYETDSKWIDHIAKLANESQLDNKIKIYKWNAKEEDYQRLSKELPNFDFAFCDGPGGGTHREWSTKLCSEKSDIVLVHDAGRSGAGKVDKNGNPLCYEREWQDKYIVGKFVGPKKGGHRCHLWIKKDKICSEKSDKVPLVKLDKGLVRVCFNGRGQGGAERSVTWIVEQLVTKGFNVVHHSPYGDNHCCGTLKNSWVHSQIKLESWDTAKEPCDVLFLYSNDHIWEWNKQEVVDRYGDLKATRKVMGINYKMGPIGEGVWTKDFDLYLFLNTEMKEILERRVPSIGDLRRTIVLAPPTDLSKFYENKPTYDGSLKLIRHSSQGNSKYPKDFEKKVKRIFDDTYGVELHLMPAPDFLKYENEKLFKHKKNDPPVNEYLELGNCFWYHLPEGYGEGGPRVILECQAAGLPVIADKSSGIIDRVAPRASEGNTPLGWVGDFNYQLDIIRNVTSQELKEKGTAAREWARKMYDPQLWIKYILGEISIKPRVKEPLLEEKNEDLYNLEGYFNKLVGD